MKSLLNLCRVGFALAVFTAPLAAVEVLNQDFENGFGLWTPVSVTSDADWRINSFGGESFAQGNGFGADTASNDWLITPPMNLSTFDTVTLNFTNAKNFDGPAIKLWVSTDYDGSYEGDPTEDGTWTEIPFTLSEGNRNFVAAGPIDLTPYRGERVYLAWQYISTGTGGGDGAEWRIDDVVVEGEGGELEVPLFINFEADKTDVTTVEEITFTASAEGGAEPYTFTWDMGNGIELAGPQVSLTYQQPGVYSVVLTALDGEGAEVSRQKTDYIMVAQATEEPIPEPAGDVRVASYNVYLNRSNEGDLVADLQAGDDPQIQAVAEIIQRLNPDVILLNEFDYVADGSAVALFQDNYLSVAQNGATPVAYPYVFIAPSNTGIPSGFDLNNDGDVGGPNDAFGFGFFPGQYAMAFLSKHPIVEEDVRTFQTFLWKDMPGALLPVDPGTGDPWFTEAELDVVRLSSKSHWDIPVEIDGKVVHCLGSHPTPPVFDGDEDRNGRRNHDEIRFWNDYVTPGQGDYIYDDAGAMGGLPAGTRFVIMGDLNADPFDGDATGNPMMPVLTNPLIDGDFVPSSQGGAQFGEGEDINGDPAWWTADFDLRVDYVLPSNYGLDILNGAVFWPLSSDVLSYLVWGDDVVSSDHRLVWLDLDVTPGGYWDVDLPDVGMATIPWIGEVELLGGNFFANEELGTFAWAGEGSAANSYWLYLFETFGWVWTNAEVYPVMWVPSRDAWVLYLYTGDPENPVLIYDYKLRRYVLIDVNDG